MTRSQNVLSWSAPKRALRYVSLDSTGYTLVVRDGIDGPALVVPFSRCTDVRVRPFDDETVSGGALDLNKVRTTPHPLCSCAQHVQIAGQQGSHGFPPRNHRSSLLTKPPDTLELPIIRTMTPILKMLRSSAYSSSESKTTMSRRLGR